MWCFKLDNVLLNLLFLFSLAPIIYCILLILLDDIPWFVLNGMGVHWSQWTCIVDWLFCQSPPSQVAMQVPSGASKTWIPKSSNKLIIFILLKTDYFIRAKKTCKALPVIIPCTKSKKKQKVISSCGILFIINVPKVLALLVNSSNALTVLHS